MNLKPCPRCGRVPDKMEIRETHLSPTMKGPGALITVYIQHFCGEATRVVTTARGRDHAEAEERWNAGL